MSAMGEFTSYLVAVKDVLEIAKSAIGLVPKSRDDETIQHRLVDAEKALRASEAEFAKALGYKLCQCTFPPQIMLSQGYHHSHNVELFRCDRCGKQHPSPNRIQELDVIKRHNEELSHSADSWLAR
jgi:hypothetical protein